MLFNKERVVEKIGDELSSLAKDPKLASVDLRKKVDVERKVVDVDVHFAHREMDRDLLLDSYDYCNEPDDKTSFVDWRLQLEAGAERFANTEVVPLIEGDLRDLLGSRWQINVWVAEYPRFTKNDIEYFVHNLRPWE